MSAGRRIALGNAAALIGLLINVLFQVALVPLYLSFWSTHTYGLWLAATATVSLLNLFDVAHQDFIGFEAMKLRPENSAGRSAMLSDALPVLAVVGASQILAVAIFFSTPFAARAFGVLPGSADARGLFWAMLVLVTVWAACQNAAGLVGRVLASLGYFPTSAWWNLATSCATGLLPIAAVAAGGGIAAAASAQVAATLIVDLMIYRSYARLLRRNGVRLHRPDLRAGFRRYATSAGLAVANILEYMQQTGFRLVVLPLLGTPRLVQFSTHRTVANVAQQGLGTLINPSIPELLRLVAARDGAKVTALVAGMIYLSVMLVCPGFLLLQLFVQRLFTLWTVGKVQFDGVSFALLSAAVMVYTVSQGSRAIVRGNNLIATQVLVSAAAGLALATAALALTPRFGLAGAAAALVAAEVVRSGSNVAVANRWLRSVSLTFPVGSLAVAAALVGITVAVTGAMAFLPGWRTALTLLYVPVWLLANLLFWLTLPSDARAFVTTVARRAPNPFVAR